MPGPQDDFDALFDEQVQAQSAPMPSPARRQQRPQAQPHVIEMDAIDIVGDPDAPEAPQPPPPQPATQGQPMSRWDRIGAMARALGGRITGTSTPEDERAGSRAWEQEMSSWIGQTQEGEATPERRVGEDRRAGIPLRALQQGLTFGLSDEMGASIASGGGVSRGIREAARSPAGQFLQTIVPSPVSAVIRQVAGTPDSYVEDYEEEVAGRRAQLRQDREDAPTQTAIMQGAGAMLPTMLTGGANLATWAARGAPNAIQGIARGALGGATEGALMGALQGVGTSEAGTFDELAGDAARGAMASGAIGGVLGGVSGGLIGHGAGRQAALQSMRDQAEAAAEAGGARSGQATSVSEADLLRAASPRVGRGGSLTTRDMQRLQRLPGGIQGHAQRIRELGLTRFGDTAQSVNERANAVMNSISSRLQGTMQRLDDSGSRIQRRDLLGILRRLRDQYDADPSLTSADGVRALEEQMQRWSGQTSSGVDRIAPEMTFTDARRLLTDLQQQAYTIGGNPSSGGTQALRDAAREIWGLLDDEAIARLGAQEAAAYRAAREQWQTANIAAEQSLESSMRQAQNMGVSLTDAMAMQTSGVPGLLLNQARRATELPARAAFAELRQRIMPPERARALAAALSGDSQPQWARTMATALQRGPQAAASAHFLLSQTDREYQEAMEEAGGELSPDEAFRDVESFFDDEGN